MSTEPRSLIRMKAHTDPSWASHRIIELKAERDALKLERDRMREAMMAARNIAEDDDRYPDDDAALDLMADVIRKALSEPSGRDDGSP